MLVPKQLFTYFKVRCSIDVKPSLQWIIFITFFLVLNQFFLDFRKELKLDKKGRWNFESCASVVNLFYNKKYWLRCKHLEPFLFNIYRETYAYSFFVIFYCSCRKLDRKTFYKCVQPESNI